MATCCRPRSALLAGALAALVVAAPAAAIGRPGVAALQVALRRHGVFAGTVDGLLGPATKHAVRRFQQRAGLRPDGVVGPRTRHALGRFGRHALGSRQLAAGSTGWDVAELQFLLAWHGFPSGPFDGLFAGHTDRALRRFQRWAGLGVDGVAGPAVFSALHRALPRSPIELAWPLEAGLGDRFGPRGNRFHAGIDLRAPLGTPVGAAAPGRVVFTGWADGWGVLVAVQNSHGVRTLYAHLSRYVVSRGQSVGTGTIVGRIGATGDATGPHLHFEVHVRGAAIDPLTALR